ncbi:hypothetical protein Patl1_14794 [Pistacia atlantica]|uniref:Uncharacterized protein n=1 Tax=Pistacia atlantica TaxID=434234 RepID=A0ACC1AW20_9ROSI|nr:hypothetical protein Patl1_14794 [Pistacia atlantica]
MLLKPLISAGIQPKMMVGGRFMQGSPKTELEVLLQNPGLPKILVQRDGDVQIWFKKSGMRNNGGSGRNPGKTWAQTAESRTQPSGGNVKAQLTNRIPEKNYMAPQPVIPPPLERGWNWQSRAGSTPSRGFEDGQKDKSVSEAYEDDADENYDDDIDDNSDAVDDSDDELLSDDFDSDTSQKSHETRKKSRWFSKFFESLDSLTVEEINEPARQWHCPACQRGPGAIDWYHGLQPLVTHAKTKGSRRIKLHRELAELLEEELHRRGTSPYPVAELFGKWKGLKDEDKDHDIIWPPMVVILNTKLEKDENDKWIGMGNQELLAYFSSYAAVKARHSYGPQGHRGISVLIFENSAGGYLEAERLHKHFSEQGTDREAWNHRQVLFLPGGKRQLYGFMALKEDLVFLISIHKNFLIQFIIMFNMLCNPLGKSKLKFELRSYQEMVVKQIRQMSEDNQQLGYFKNKVDKAQRHSKSLEASFSIVSERLRKTMEENRIVKQRTRLQHAQNKEEMDFQEQFFKDQIKIIHEARDLKEEDFEMVQQQEREKVKQSIENPSNTEDYKKRVERMAHFIKFQDKEMEEFVEERDQKIKVHEDKKSAMRRRHLEEELELEKEFDAELSSLMEKYSLISQKLLPPRTGREIYILN